MMNYEAVEILIIEDNPDDAELFIRALKKKNLANSFTIIEDGAEAIDYLFGTGKYTGTDHLKPLRVIFLDLKLPKVSGLEVLKKIKEDERTKTLPVVVVTSSREDPDIKTAYDLGVNSYVVKPVNFDDFLVSMGNVGLYWLLVNEIPSGKV